MGVAGPVEPNRHREFIFATLARRLRVDRRADADTVTGPITDSDERSTHETPGRLRSWRAGSRRTLSRLADRLPSVPGEDARGSARTTPTPRADHGCGIGPDNRWGPDTEHGDRRGRDDTPAATGCPRPLTDVFARLARACAPTHRRGEGPARGDDHESDGTVLIGELERRELLDGPLTVDERTGLLDLMRLRVASGSGGAALRRRLVDRLLSAGRFDEARMRADPDDPSTRPDLIDAAALTALGEHRLARHVRMELAERIADSRPARHAALGEFVDWVAAVGYRHGPEAGLQAVESRWAFAGTRHERSVRDALRSEMLLELGDADAFAEINRHVVGPTPDAAREFRRLVEGRRVLVVGAHRDDSGPQPDGGPTAADVVIRVDGGVPAVESLDGAASIVWIDARATRTGLRSIVAPTGSAVDLFVVRPPCAMSAATLADTLDALHADTSGRVRIASIADHDTALGERGTLSAVVHDVLAFSPASISVAGFDLSTPVGSAAGDGATAGMRPGSDRCVDRRADLAHDHRILRASWRSALIDVDDALRDLLDLDTTDFLALVERSELAPDHDTTLIGHDHDVGGPRRDDGSRTT